MNKTLRARIFMALTEYDRKQSTKKHHNPYALAHYCGALERLEERVNNGVELRKAICQTFHGAVGNVVMKAAGLPKMTNDEQRF